MPIPGDDAERHPDHNRYQQGERREFHRRREPFDEQLRDRLVEPEGRPQIAGDDIADVDAELREDRLVEPVSLVVGIAQFVGGPFAKGGPAGISRNQTGEREHESQDPDEHRDGREKPAYDESSQGSAG